jgi:hypothetical protein
MTTYTHDYDIVFSVKGSTDCDAKDVTPEMIREALLERIAKLQFQDWRAGCELLGSYDEEDYTDVGGREEVWPDFVNGDLV